MQENQEEPKPKHQDKIVALDSLSLGISIVAAIIIGFGIGYGLKQLIQGILGHYGLVLFGELQLLLWMYIEHIKELKK